MFDSIQNAKRLVRRALLCFVVASSPALLATDLSSYRSFQFGMSLPEAVKSAVARTADVKTIHERPALIQELEWRPEFKYQKNLQNSDPVKDGVLCFLNGELFRIVVRYDRYKVEGMSRKDMVDAISATYGEATTPEVEIPYRSDYGYTAKVLARWEDADHSFNLVETGDRSSFALVLFSKRVNTLAEQAQAEALRLDKKEAPQRAIDAKNKEASDARTALDEARTANKRTFKP